MMEICILAGADARAHRRALASLLVECVEGGASVSFMAPLERSAAESFFDSVMEEVNAGRRVLLAAFDGSSLVGTVQVLLAMPPNQPHRGEIAKLLVSPAARGRGVGAELMRHAEEQARLAGKTLLVLDTASSTAEALYLRQGWTRVGVIPGYALLPDGSPCNTTIFWKALTATKSSPQFPAAAAPLRG